MNRVLFLDDNNERCERAKILYDGHELTIVKTAKETIDKLAENEYDLVSLDHDLGNEVYVDSGRKDSGMEVVRWILANKPIIPVILIHSWNLPARVRNETQSFAYWICGRTTSLRNEVMV